MDGVPELLESAWLNLTSVTTLRGVLTSSTLMTIEIPANDVPYGTIGLFTTGQQSRANGGRLGVPADAAPRCTEPLVSPYGASVTSWGQATTACPNACQCIVMTRSRYDPRATDVRVFVEAYNPQPSLNYFDVAQSNIVPTSIVGGLTIQSSIGACADHCWRDTTSSCKAFTTRTSTVTVGIECQLYADSAPGTASDTTRTVRVLNVLSRSAARPYQDWTPGPREFRVSGTSDLVFIPVDFLADSVSNYYYCTF